MAAPPEPADPPSSDATASGSASSDGAWGRWVYRNRKGVLLASALFLAVAIAVLARGGTLGTGTIEGIESARGLKRIEEALGRPGESQFTIVFRSETLRARDPAFAAAMRAALATLRADPRVLSVRAPDDLPGPLAERYYSRDGRGAIAVVGMKDEVRRAGRIFPELRFLVRSETLSVQLTGYLAFKTDLDAVLEKDLLRSELVSIPLAVIVLLAVFRSLVAGLLPAGVGALAVVGGVACVTALSRVTDVAQYAINVVTLIGLGVAIDYSLFIASRFRDERRAGLDIESALAVTLATAGRAVVFSGLAVAIGLAGLLFFPRSYLEIMGIAGTIVVTLAMIFALTFLPALLAVLGPALEWGRLPFALPEGTGLWRRFALWVMARPIAVLLPTLAIMVAAGLPFARLRLAAADISVLPRTEEARIAHEYLREQVPDAVATRIAVVVDFPGGEPLSRERTGALVDLSRRIARVPGVTRVESLFDLGADMERLDYQDLWAEREHWPETLRPYVPESVGASTVLLSAVTAAAPSSDEARAIVRAIRMERQVADGALLVTGQTANDVDSTDFILSRAPAAVGFVMGMTAIVLFLLLGSVVMPIKALVMNVLSIAGSFGALVWIFQEGHGASLLRFEPGPIEPTLPVLLFCCVFGLSMDYEVLLLCRIEEEWLRTKDNARSVAEGLEQSGRLITSAAAIMVAVFLAFALAQVVLVKAMGVGMAIAVALDATIVRILIVPSTMRLFGDWNWWAPAWLKRLRERLGVGH